MADNDSNPSVSLRRLWLGLCPIRWCRLPPSLGREGELRRKTLGFRVFMNHHQKALRHLAKRDKVMAGLVKQIKLQPLAARKNHFQSLVTSIISQQLSVKAAATIEQRFVDLFKGRFPSSSEILKKSDRVLRKSGLSGSKISYIKNIAREVEQGRLNFKKLSKKSDEEIIAELTQIKGIGRWTAEMFLIFSLRHLDIYSQGDLGLKNAVTKLYKINPKFHTRKLQTILENWKPYRSVASRLLWKSLEL